MESLSLCVESVRPPLDIQIAKKRSPREAVWQSARAGSSSSHSGRDASGSGGPGAARGKMGGAYRPTTGQHSRKVTGLIKAVTEARGGGGGGGANAASDSLAAAEPINGRATWAGGSPSRGRATMARTGVAGNKAGAAGGGGDARKSYDASPSRTSPGSKSRERPKTGPSGANSDSSDSTVAAVSSPYRLATAEQLKSDSNAKNAGIVVDVVAERERAAKRVEERRRKEYERSVQLEQQRLADKRLDADRLAQKAEEKELFRSRIYAQNELMRVQEWAVYKQWEKQRLAGGGGGKASSGLEVLSDRSDTSVSDASTTVVRHGV